MLAAGRCGREGNVGRNLGSAFGASPAFIHHLAILKQTNKHHCLQQICQRLLALRGLRTLCMCTSLCSYPKRSIRLVSFGERFPKCDNKRRYVERQNASEQNVSHGQPTGSRAGRDGGTFLASGRRQCSALSLLSRVLRCVLVVRR